MHLYSSFCSNFVFWCMNIAHSTDLDLSLKYIEYVAKTNIHLFDNFGQYFGLDVVSAATLQSCFCKL